MAKNQEGLSRPVPPPVKLAAIPEELKNIPSWVAWRYERRGDVWDKPPVNCRTGRYADVTNPAACVPFEEAVEFYRRRKLAGIGFVFAADGPYSGIDLDDCRDPATGKFTDEAEAIIRQLASYTEVSPSGTGVKIIVRGKAPKSGRRCKGVEIYR